MEDKFAIFGTDLRLLNDLEHQSSRVHGEDLAVTRSLSGKYDLETVHATANLQQALLLRFMTPVGELTDLGHPTYGSRLVDLIGELNTERTRNRAKLYTLQALAAEPRVREVLAIDVREGGRSRLDIDVTVKVEDLPTPINLVFPFFLDTGGGS